jgi:hypothetical protein
VGPGTAPRSPGDPGHPPRCSARARGHRPQGGAARARAHGPGVAPPSCPAGGRVGVGLAPEGVCASWRPPGCCGGAHSISRLHCGSRRAVVARSAGNVRPVQGAIRPTTTAGWGKKAAWNAGRVRVPWRRQEPGCAGRPCRPRSTWGGRCSKRGCGASGASGVGAPPGWPGGTRAGCSSAGACRGAGQAPRRSARASTCVGGVDVSCACISSGA